MGQPGDAREHPQPAAELWDLILELPGQFRPFRTGADNAHLAAQDVDDLGHLVQAAGPQRPAQSGHPGIVDPGPHRPESLLGVPDHGAKLDDAEDASVLAQPLLPVEHGAPVANQDGQRDQRPQQDPHRQEQQVRQRQRRQVVGPLVPGHEPIT